MNLFTAVLYLHIASVVVSVGLFVLRYWCYTSDPEMVMQHRVLSVHF